MHHPPTCRLMSSLFAVTAPLRALQNSDAAQFAKIKKRKQEEEERKRQEAKSEVTQQPPPHTTSNVDNCTCTPTATHILTSTPSCTLSLSTVHIHSKSN